MVAGVCAGLGKRLQVDPLLVRFGFVATTLASGIGLVLYVLAWILMPAEKADDGHAARRDRRPRPPRHGRGRARRGLLAARRPAGVPRARAAVLRRPHLAAHARRGGRRADLAPLDGRPGRGRAAGAAERRAHRERRRRRATAPAPAGESRPAVISRIGIGVTLVIAAAIVFLQFTGALAAATDVALAALVVAIAFGVIFAPWFVRLREVARRPSARSASARRSAPRSPRTCTTRCCRRSRSCRSAPATRARSPRSPAARSASCARGCRARPAHEAGERWLAAELEAAAQEVEEAHGVPIDVVAVGDARARPRRRGARRRRARGDAQRGEVRGRATRRSPSTPRRATERLQVFVRDRGPGFDPSAVPADRRGVRESIVGRMERHGGRAAIHASPGGGTEVELVLDRSAS